MVIPATPPFPTGPALGTLFPDFTLPDQYGTPINFTAARDGKRAMIVVHRSAAW
jgi:hypothetical protein